MIKPKAMPAAERGAMKERGIIFSGEMVRVILAGRKTQTRRVIKEPRVATLHGRRSLPERSFFDRGFGDGPYLHWAYGGGDHGDEYVSTRVYCPYGKPEDRLFVLETWGLVHEHHEKVGDKDALRDARERMPWASVIYRADANGGHAESHRVGNRWRPAIHMPRSASRLTLEITEVRAQRLQDISDEDARAEGISGPHDVGYPAFRAAEGDKPRYSSARAAFEELWDSINGGTWEDNPWVWALTFRRLEGDQ